LPGAGHEILGTSAAILELALPDCYRSTEATARDRVGESDVREAAR
jgi:hypothetical protein